MIGEVSVPEIPGLFSATAMKQNFHYYNKIIIIFRQNYLHDKTYVMYPETNLGSLMSNSSIIIDRYNLAWKCYDCWHMQVV